MHKLVQLKEGVTIHFINTEKFKTNVAAIFLTIKLSRDNITKEALIPAVLRRGTNDIETQQELNQKLEEMYGANFNCGIEKRGDNHILKFYIESINDDLTLEGENILKQSIEFIFNIILNPLVENESFNHEYVEGEKQTLKNIIRS